jgi:hypothetical protein
MSEKTYRLVELRNDRTQVVIATGLPEEIAAQVRELLSTEQPAT